VAKHRVTSIRLADRAAAPKGAIVGDHNVTGFPISGEVRRAALDPLLTPGMNDPSNGRWSQEEGFTERIGFG